MNEIRNKYEQFKHDSIREEAMRAFAKYMKDKMISKQYKKEKKRDLGLAAVDTHVIFTQMERNDSKNYKLVKTTDQRPSMKDLNATRPTNYLDSYLERVTDEVKVPKSVVRAIQEESDYDMIANNSFDAGSSYMRGSVFRSKKGSVEFTMHGKRSSKGFFPKLLPSERGINHNISNYQNSPHIQN